MKSDAWRAILKQACVLSGASWAARLYCDGDDWHVESVWGLPKREQEAVFAHLEPAWLNGALASGRPRARKRGDFYWQVFPQRAAQTLWLVGSRQRLDAAGRQIWKLLCDVHQAAQQDVSGLGVFFGAQTPSAVKSAPPHETQAALGQVLHLFLQVGRSTEGWLAVVSGNELQVYAASAPEVRGRGVLLSPAVIQELRLQTGRPADVDENIAPLLERLPSAAWLVLIPVLDEGRPIALVALWRDEPFTPRELTSLEILSRYTVLTIGSLVMLADVSAHARRLGVLNDFVRTVSVAAGLEKSIERAFHLLRGTFGTTLISLALFSADREQLRVYRLLGGKVHVQISDAAHSPLTKRLLHGRLMRCLRPEELAGAPRLHSESRSLLWSPLRHGGEIIGGIVLESMLPQAFSSGDEALLAGIASHLSGVVEYGRLLEDAETHARNLEVLHVLVRRLLALQSIPELTETTAQMLSEAFDETPALVALQDAAGEYRHAWTGDLEPVRMDNFGQEIRARAAAAAEQGRILVNDPAVEATSAPWLLGEEAASFLTIPVVMDDAPVGLIHVESRLPHRFSRSDVLTLDALAGVLGNVAARIWQYQNLRETVQRLEEARLELQARMESQRLAENRLLQAAKLAAVGEMAAGVAHELNNPLTTVIGFTELTLQNDALPADVREDLGMVLQEARRARDVVRRLLDFSRQSEGALTRSDLNAVIEDVLALVRRFLENRNVQLLRALQPDLPWVMMDPNRMKQVFLNLIHNALDAMPNGGTLTLRSYVVEEDEAHWACVDVEDTGIGIPPDVLPRIFEPFFTTRGGNGGTGLGLAVTYGIVQDHRGRIEVQSQIGAGSRFTIWLPIEEEGL
jgi:signal transduction histidine kinase